MKQLRKLFTFISGIILILALGACTPTIEPRGSQPAPEGPTAQPEKPAEKQDQVNDKGDNMIELDGTIWDLISITDLDVAGNGISLEFKDGMISGSDGCNRYRAGYKLESDNLVILGGFMSSMRACSELIMQLGSNYLNALESAGTLALADGTLTIQTDQGELVFKAPESAGIEGTKWRLSSTHTELGAVSMAIDENIFFSISNGEVGGDGGCNSFGGNVTIDGLQISFSEIVFTEMFCEGDGVSDREAEFFGILENVASYEILRQTLTLLDRNGEKIATFRAG